MIKTIFYDLDGVLTTDFNGTETVCRHLCDAIPDLSIASVMESYRKHCGPLLVGGKFADVWDEFCTEIGQTIPPDVLRDALGKVPINEPMLALVQSLRKKYRLGIITDNPVERMEVLHEEMKLAELFNPVIISGAVHALKHDGTTTMFDAALHAANCDPEESVFIDNQERNLVTPSTMGMKVYWHDDKRNDISSFLTALRGWNVEI